MIFHRKLWAAWTCIAMGGAGCSGDDGPGGGSGDSGAIEVQISGEELAADGFLFPDGSEVALADGWEIEFTHVLVTVGNLTLAANPDKVPSDQSQTDAVVAEAAGPWAVDLHRPGSVPAAGGEGTAVPITVFERQNRNGDAAFDPTERYAFGFDLVAASDAAAKLNFEGDAAAEEAYAEMVANGYAVMYVGTATFVGGACEVSDDAYDFDAVPPSVEFRLGFATPASFQNCQNQENQGEPFDGEEFQRGIPIFTNRASTAQITLHLDHPFFSDVEHEPALYFTQMAARLVGRPEGSTLTTEDFTGVDPTALTDGAGAPLPWRVCDGSALPATAQMSFEVGSLNVDPAGDPGDALRDYRDFVHYVQSAQGHLNGGEGLCFVRRDYAAPE